MSVIPRNGGSRDESASADETVTHIDGTNNSSAQPVTRHSGGLSRDELFTLLGNERRRLVLSHLKRATDRIPIRTLSQEIAASQNNVTVEAVTKSERKRVYVSLYQHHLPKLAEREVISWECDKKAVAPGPNATQLYPYLQDTPDAGPRETAHWPKYYLGLATISFGVFLGAEFGPIRENPLTTVALGVVLIALVGLTLLHMGLVSR